MSRMSANRPPMGAALAFVVAGAMLLGGCSGRDTDLAEQVGAANAAADRAEKAAEQAEKAAKDAASSQVVEVEPEPEPVEEFAPN